MSSNFLFGISLTGSFLAGILALFAPCCITFLLPSYLGTIFKKSEKVFFYTAIFALGLAAILLPVALGFRFIVFLFDDFHQEFYYLGAVALILIGLMTYFEVKIPALLSISTKPKERIDIFSIFSLGVISGITTSCCAPVLFAAMTLTSLAPTFFQAVVVSFAYVLGIVSPLFLLSFFYEKISSQFLTQARKKIYDFSKILAAATFILSGVIIGILAYLHKIQMGQMEGYTQGLRFFVFEVSKYFQNPLLDISVFVSLLYVFYRMLKRKDKKD